jgi:vacuolar-type H+-ATPase subunit E/Vma4
MNKERRKRIEEASAKIAEAALQAAQEIIQEVRDGEESARENLPESLQDGERGQAMQEAIDALDSALSEIEGVYLSEISSQLETAAQ